MEKFLMGNEAIALGALDAGVGFVSGYPGTPSTEVLETVAKYNDGSVYVEWSVNEKSAMEAAAGAAYAGARTMVTMKQVGLNVASDPLMSLAYVGVKGGMIVLVADDPGPISSQTEQDTRMFAMFSKLPVFDPSSPEEAYAMVAEAFELSEKHGTPVILRSTTRVCHGCATVNVKEHHEPKKAEGFVKDTQRWVIFPRTSFLNHKKIEARNPVIGKEFCSSPFNSVEHADAGRRGIATHGINYAYTSEALALLGAEAPLLKVVTPFPFPEDLGVEFLKSVDEVLCVEELDPVIERVLEALGVKSVQVVNPLELDAAKQAVARAAEEKGVSAIIFRSPCIAVVKPNKALTVDADKCIGCKICINKLGCPALVMENGKAKVEPGLCTGCTLCSQVCPKKAIG